MSFIDNVNIIRKRYPHLWRNGDIPHDLQDSYKVEMTRSGLPTIIKVEPGRSAYLHSKYDPIKEAEALLSGYEDLENYEHVVFYGIGFGYHIQQLHKHYPDKEMTIYEPIEEIFHYFLHHCDLQDLPLKNIKNFYVKQKTDDQATFMRIPEQIKEQKTLLVIMPSYQRAFPAECVEFSKAMLQSVKDRREEISVNAKFQKLWVKNCLHNLVDTLTTPDLFSDVDKSCFAGKPALLVAAGPSLAEEIENIRKIKEAGLAYIFAAGSSISILLNHNILPDAVCTYDPGESNYLAVEPIVERGITTIPMIYGTSVGHKTVEKYSGPKIHFFTSEDRIGYYLLNQSVNDENPDIVMDAPSIAVVTFQLLARLGCEPIILVGQNLALKGDRYYPEGIKYYDNMQREEEKIKVEDVEGNWVETTEGYISMRKVLEMWIGNYSHRKVINTTRGGAKIVGTEFNYLENIIKDYLIRSVVSENWYTNNTKIYPDDMVKRIDLMDRDLENLPEQLAAIERVLAKMSSAISRNKAGAELNRLLPKFDKAFNDIMKNNAHSIFLESMNRMEFQLLIKKIRQAELEPNQVKRAELVADGAASYFAHCKQDWQEISSIWSDKAADLKRVISLSKQE